MRLGKFLEAIWREWVDFIRPGQSQDENMTQHMKEVLNGDKKEGE